MRYCNSKRNYNFCLLISNFWGDHLMPAEHNWNLGFAMSNLAKLKIRWDTLADFHLNAFEVNFDEHNQRFEFL